MITQQPNKIYLNTGDVKEDVNFYDLFEVTWSADKISESDIEYISSNHIQQKFQNALNSYSKSNSYISQEIVVALKLVKHFIFENGGTYKEIVNGKSK